MGKKTKRKIKLPIDKTGEPIHIDDVLRWADGTRMKVDMLTYYGELRNGEYCWTAESEDGDFTDNLGASTIVWRKGK